MRCWNHWLGLCYERKRLQSFGRRLQSAGLGKGWNTWLEYCYDRDRLAGIMGKAANGPLNKAWNSWLEALEDIARMRSVLGRVIDGRAARAFNRCVHTCACAVAAGRRRWLPSARASCVCGAACRLSRVCARRLALSVCPPQVGREL